MKVKTMFSMEYDFGYIQNYVYNKNHKVILDIIQINKQMIL